MVNDCHLDRWWVQTSTTDSEEQISILYAYEQIYIHAVFLVRWFKEIDKMAVLKTNPMKEFSLI